MSRLLCELEIDAACWEYLARRIVAHGGAGLAQPIVTVLDAMPPEEDDVPDDWDELTARAARMCAPGETTLEATERVLGKVGL